MSVTKEQVVEFISNMTVLELADFIKELEEKFGCLVFAYAYCRCCSAAVAANYRSFVDVGYGYGNVLGIGEGSVGYLDGYVIDVVAACIGSAFKVGRSDKGQYAGILINGEFGRIGSAYYAVGGCCACIYVS